MMMFLFEIDDLYHARIVSRPSKTCKSPYVADVYVDEFNETDMAHAPSLGCGGLCNKSSNVYVSLHPNPSTCNYVIQLAEITSPDNNKYLIGIHPKCAENIVHRCLHLNAIESLSNLRNITPEVNLKEHGSRFDFVVKDEFDIETIIEVKNVPLADYEDIYDKDRKIKTTDIAVEIKFHTSLRDIGKRKMTQSVHEP